jgi:hypothetical protein
MPTVKNENVETVKAEAESWGDVVGVFGTLAKLRTLVPLTIASGNVKRVQNLRKVIVRLMKASASLRKAFDDSLEASQNGFKGSDFLKGVEPIRKPRETKNPKMVRMDEFSSDDLDFGDDE